MKRKCADGPYEGRKVSANLGRRWPFVLSFDYKTSAYMLGYYELNEQTDQYNWNASTIEQGYFR